PRGDDDGGSQAERHEAEDLPTVPAEDPKVVSQGNGGLLGRLGVVTIPGRLDGLIWGGKRFEFRHVMATISEACRGAPFRRRRLRATSSRGPPVSNGDPYYRARRGC